MCMQNKTFSNLFEDQIRLFQPPRQRKATDYFSPDINESNCVEVKNFHNIKTFLIEKYVREEQKKIKVSLIWCKFLVITSQSLL